MTFITCKYFFLYIFSPAANKGDKQEVLELFPLHRGKTGECDLLKIPVKGKLGKRLPRCLPWTCSDSYVAFQNSYNL